MSKESTLQQYPNLNSYLKECAKQDHKSSDYYRHLLGEALGLTGERQIYRVLSIPISQIKNKHRALHWTLKAWENSTESNLFDFLQISI